MGVAYGLHGETVVHNEVAKLSRDLAHTVRQEYSAYFNALALQAPPQTKLASTHSPYAN